MAHRTVTCNLYHVTIYITTSRASAVKVFNKVLTTDAARDALKSIDQPKTSGYAFDCMPHGVIIHIKHKRPDVIAHECLHAAAYILSDRG